MQGWANFKFYLVHVGGHCDSEDMRVMWANKPEPTNTMVWFFLGLGPEWAKQCFSSRPICRLASFQNSCYDRSTYVCGMRLSLLTYVSIYLPVYLPPNWAENGCRFAPEVLAQWGALLSFLWAPCWPLTATSPIQQLPSALPLDICHRALLLSSLFLPDVAGNR